MVAVKTDEPENTGLVATCKIIGFGARYRVPLRIPGEENQLAKYLEGPSETQPDPM